MIRDPIFGGIDWDGVRQLAFMLGCSLFLVSFAAATSGSWYDPYVWFWGFASEHSTAFIFGTMFFLIALHMWHQFESGRL